MEQVLRRLAPFNEENARITFNKGNATITFTRYSTRQHDVSTSLIYIYIYIYIHVYIFITALLRLLMLTGQNENISYGLLTIV